MVYRIYYFTFYSGGQNLSHYRFNIFALQQTLILGVDFWAKMDMTAFLKNNSWCLGFLELACDSDFKIITAKSKSVVESFLLIYHHHFIVA